MSTSDDFKWLETSAKTAAQRLLNCQIISTTLGSRVVVRIVETEAYDQNDAASHAFKGQTKRNNAMFLGAGHLYVYFTYGMHYCCNVVCGPAGFGSGVLIRAVEPLSGTDTINKRRKIGGINATNGPGKVCQALDINLSHSGHDLSKPPIKLVKKPPLLKQYIASSPRIGISKAINELSRFYIKDNSYVSRYKRTLKE